MVEPTSETPPPWYVRHLLWVLAIVFVAFWGFVILAIVAIYGFR